jgi:glutamate-1-semialdehyde 2,1-aminomutase
MEGIEGILADKGVDGKVTGHPAMFSVYLGEGHPKEFRDTGGHDSDLYEDVCFRMIRRGVMPCPDALEPWFVCAAHSDEDVAETLAALEESLADSLAGK